MSGICGCLRLDGREVLEAELAAMTRQLEGRGPEGVRHYQGGSVALGHTLLATTPEALVEQLPLIDSDSGCWITADLRLDNREELFDLLGLHEHGRVIGDGELALRAYLRWGEDCPKHLLGDFAFVIWDPRNQHLFCARDHLGIKPLIYSHQPGEVFAFASEADAVLQATDVPRTINQARIADFLEHYLEGVDFTSTMFEEVFRLPPAHCARVARDGLHIWRYWRLKPGSELRLESDEAYAEAFLAVFSKAVDCRLRTVGPVGSMLSGGMDSGSVVAVASQLLAKQGRGPLHTFSCVGPDPGACVETQSIRAAINMPGLEPHVASHDDLAQYMDDLIHFTRESGEPFDGHMALVRTACLMARRAGVKILFNGVGGDDVLSSSFRLPRLIRAGRWIEGWNEAKGQAHFWSGNPVRFYRYGFRQALTPGWARRIRRRWGIWRDRSLPEGPLLDPEFAKRVDLAGRRAKFLRHRSPVPLPQAALRAQSVGHTFQVVGRERYDRVVAAMGLEQRDPFVDLRVVEFCLRLPEEQVGGRGWHKWILRRAMAGLLPDAVRWRTGKQHLGGDFIHAMLVNWGDPGFSAADCGQGSLECIAGSADVDPTWASPESRVIACTADVLYLHNWLERASAK